MDGNSPLIVTWAVVMVFGVGDSLVSGTDVHGLRIPSTRTLVDQSASTTAADIHAPTATFLVDVNCADRLQTVNQLRDVIGVNTRIKIIGQHVEYGVGEDAMPFLRVDYCDPPTNGSLWSEVMAAVEKGIRYTGREVVIVTDHVDDLEMTADALEAHITDSGIRVSFVCVSTLPTLIHSEHVRRRAAGQALSNTLSIYQQIAQITGGQTINTNKANIGKVVGLLSQVTKTNTVDILRFTFNGRPGSHMSVPIDDTIYHFMVQLQTDFHPPAFVLPYLPSGIYVSFSNTSGNTRTTLGGALQIMEMNTTRPTDYGLWRFEKMDSAPWHVTVTAQSKLDFTHVFLERGAGGYGEYPLRGRPIAGCIQILVVVGVTPIVVAILEGSSLKLSVTVPQYSLVQAVTTAMFVRQDNSAIDLFTLTNVGGRRGMSRFYVNVTIPTEDFIVAIEGVDNSGHGFRRVDPVMVSPASIRLYVPSMTGVTLYKNELLSIPFTVSNTASMNQDIDVKIEDDKGFSQAPLVMSYSLGAKENISSTLSIRGGNNVGETVTVTITARSPARHGVIQQGQYEVIRFTVQERHNKMPNDTTSPTCDVTKVVGQCQLGADLCSCSQHQWTMHVEVGDVGFGLQDVFTTRAGSNDSFVHDNFTVGHTLSQGLVTASLRADCCHQNAAIHVEDRAGNMAQCRPNITHNFKPPDPQFCSNTNPNFAIPCMVTHTVGSCMIGRDPCDCHTRIWTARAEFGTVGWPLYSTFARGAGSNSTIHRTGQVVDLNVDCCHQQLTLVGADIANNMGECHVSLSSFQAPNATYCMTKRTASTSPPTAVTSSTPATTAVTRFMATSQSTLTTTGANLTRRSTGLGTRASTLQSTGTSPPVSSGTAAGPSTRQSTGTWPVLGPNTGQSMGLKSVLMALANGTLNSKGYLGYFSGIVWST